MNPVNSSVFHVQRHDTNAFSIIVHHEVHGKVFNEVGGVERKTATIQGVKHGMTGAVCSSTAAVSLRALAVIQTLTTESALVNLAVFSTRERQSKLFKFQNCFRGFTTHVMDSILVAKPIRSLDGIVHVPSPVILAHISERSIDSTLCSNSMGSSGEQLGDAGCFETSFTQAHGCTQTRTSSPDNDSVIGVINDGVVTFQVGRETTATGCTCTCHCLRVCHVTTGPNGCSSKYHLLLSIIDMLRILYDYYQVQSLDLIVCFRAALLYRNGL
mmetsp:Transcript_23235/g.38497  ORF Transcript_23235/g.38497 Transcript_23235/m.38497 type:complete len:271 (+) Transcript_23235:1361-2173(+)